MEFKLGQLYLDYDNDLVMGIQEHLDSDGFYFTFLSLENGSDSNLKAGEYYKIRRTNHQILKYTDTGINLLSKFNLQRVTQIKEEAKL